MAASTTQTANRTQTNGLLPVTASQTSGNATRPVAAKPPAPKLKVIVRRLAPCLTEAEFTSILGDEWKLGQGKVDWFLYKPGKESKEYALSIMCHEIFANGNEVHPSPPDPRELIFT
jgi:regulator of nonsense transcripts 3